jgi:hypothetical protein
MFIIAGAGHPKSEKFITKQTQYCYRCNNDAYWILEKTKHHISLFFVPVVPYKTEYSFYCAICGNTTRLDKETFDRKVRIEARTYLLKK